MKSVGEWWTRALNGTDPRCCVIQKVWGIPLYAKGLVLFYRWVRVGIVELGWLGSFKDWGGIIGAISVMDFPYVRKGSVH